MTNEQESIHPLQLLDLTKIPVSGTADPGPRNKTAAARILMHAGWTFEEVAAVLGEDSDRPFSP